MFDMVLNMPRVLNMPGFWIYQGSDYASGSEYARVTQSSEYARIILEHAWIIPGYALVCLIMPEYTKTCVNMPKSAWMAFVLHFPIVIPWRLECVVTLFQRLHETRSYSLKEHEPVFLKSWKRLICIFVLDWLFLQVRFQICFYLWRPGKPKTRDRESWLNLWKWRLRKTL